MLALFFEVLGGLIGLAMLALAVLGIRWANNAIKQNAAMESSRRAVEDLDRALAAQEVEARIMRAQLEAQKVAKEVQDKIIERQDARLLAQDARILDLTEQVTQRAAVEDFRDECRRAFQVIAAKVGAELPTAS